MNNTDISQLQQSGQGFFNDHEVDYTDFEKVSESRTNSEEENYEQL